MSLNRLLDFKHMAVLYVLNFASAEVQAQTEKQILGVWSINGGLYFQTQNAFISKFNGQEHIEFEIKNDKITALASNDNSICLGTYNGAIHFLKNGAHQKIELPVQPSGYPYLISGVVNHNDYWLISTLEGSLFKLDDNTVNLIDILKNEKSGTSKNITHLAIDNNNLVWAASIDQVYFYTDIHNSRKKEMKFLASGNFNTSTQKLISSTAGVYVLINADDKNHLYLGTLTESIMDALKKEQTLPNEFLIKTIENLVFTQESLWLLGEKQLYQLKNSKWTVYDFQPTDADEITSFTVLKNKLYLGAKNGLFETNFN